MRALTLIAALLLTSCASHNLKDTHAWGDLDRDGCIAYQCRAYCKTTATPEQVAAFNAGTVDDLERAALKRLRIGVGADVGSTIAALFAACNAAGAPVTLAQCQVLVTQSDVSGDDPWVAMARRGLQLVRVPL